MNKIFSFFVLSALVFSGGMAYAQNGNGGITPEMLSRISEGYSGTPEQKAVRNALASNPLSAVAVNAENLAMMDTHFSDVVKTEGITDQKSSGRCWLFTGLNVLRAKMIEKYDLGDFYLSQNYLFFYDQLEKSNLFLQAIIDTRNLPWDDRTVDWLLRNPLSDGGQFTGVSNLIMKYGMVPAEVMPETYSANNTSQMAGLIKRKLREYALEIRENAGMKEKALGNRKEEMLSEIYRMLVYFLGEPPVSFEWSMWDRNGNLLSTKEYTPKSFYDEYIGEDLEDNYIMVMNDPSREYGKVYEIEYDRHVYDGHNWLFVNLPIEKIKEMAIASIKGGCAMYFSCDVGKFLDSRRGTLNLDNYDYSSLLGTDFGMDKAERIRTYDSGSTHAMTLIAVDIDENGNPVKWMVENSWGPAAGYQGKLIMTDEWFDEYMFRVVVEKQFVPEDVMEMMKQQPIKLPPWDPMFVPEM
ncbi:aminopeptidase [Muribaculum sp. An289]|uniref:C1 family peptidase n=1 Tax=unclassified Muribaculum TaxID=2622126 RepID=UPI000B3A27D7|nr:MULTISPECIES: C1 family peptidase [unclassified Muribaculum]OUO36354.1 aminopeptidase [Muribaculum sp. An289]OUO41988.1 aminopeptidase [Muribaculum sp. An287]